MLIFLLRFSKPGIFESCRAFFMDTPLKELKIWNNGRLGEPAGMVTGKVLLRKSSNVLEISP